MSKIELQAGPPDNPVRVIITSDGEMLFPDGELERDQMMAFMTGQETDLIELDREWNKFPIPTIIGKFGVPEAIKQTLLVDAAEHVLPILERVAPEIGRRQPGLARSIIRQCRLVLRETASEDTEHGTPTREAKTKLSSMLDRLYNEVNNDQYLNHEYMPMQHVFSAIHYAAQRLSFGVFNTNFDSSCLAAALDADPSAHYVSGNSEAWNQAHRKQELWVIAHFVDLMNTLYDAVREQHIEPHK